LYLLTVNDHASSRLAVTFEYSSVAGWGNALPTTATDLIHVKIDIANAAATAGLGFQESLMIGCQFYDDNATIYKRLSESEGRYRSLFENAVEGISHSTPDGRFIRANPALARIFGYDSPEDLISSITDLATQTYVHSEDRKELRRILEEEGQAIGFETRLYRKDGSVIWVSINSRSVHASTGELLYYESLVTDITKRKQAEQALQESLERYRLLMEATPDPVYGL